MKDRDGRGSNPTVMLALPSYTKMNDPFNSLNSTKYERLFLKLKDPNDKEAITKLILDFKNNFTPSQSNAVKFYNYQDTSETNDQVT
jgi:hypothetical protein